MSEHQRPLIGAHLMLIENGKILLQKRNSGALNGYYSPVSGHVDDNESVIDAMIREAKEEANIMIKPEDLKVSVVAHLTEAPYKGGRENIINFFMFADKYEGKITNMEPDKTESLEFYDLDNLPDKLMSHIFDVVKAYKNGDGFIVWRGKNAQHS